MHDTAHIMAGKTVTIANGVFSGSAYRIEDWWDRVAGKSWMFCDGNPACLDYACRAGVEGKPTDDEVVYGHIDGLGKLIHVRDLLFVRGVQNGSRESSDQNGCEADHGR